MEIWKVIPGYENYSVSNLGRVIGPFGGVLNPAKLRDGYIQASICKDGTCKGLKVHKLVAAAFLDLDLSNKKIQINHLDGNPSNNKLDNLEICNQSRNMLHRSSIAYPEDSDTHKTCRKRQKLRLRSEFTINRRSRDCLDSYCKACQ